MITIFTLINLLLAFLKKLDNFVCFLTPVVKKWLIHMKRLVAAPTLLVLSRLVIYPMPGNNATLKFDFTDPRKRNFVSNLFYIPDLK